ncbi:UDP-N-acetylmuramoyl-L-alanyl-D-glutamate--2,6-diaminopimelate ligase [Thermosulfurimonas sp. F29]|uniref:UDP-N-acetylmuramoyl-L-alanyl-D-glutamate--2, 6-diaminopimelate ligase n=1 Tax=Thermosulfurimonas sp. F29 TaxID=2867247 RepID=UPI001C8299C2|nr:UDP-N-acetylmuramoyl-L-alanyl-D-glutamate--2,6-diaminopimelate ligase [Thermosulfurimonas sp. F29]MBX6422080.1 UDP-N-acetylmuramoyl-L-alanyl-D-glutamate--2,6-diaminopimelate ligase [Thermosulfurimonas sp. F29]
MKLRELLCGIEALEVRGEIEVEVSSVEEDSRRVRPGALFVARRGTRTDGHRYIGEAVRRGAVAVVREDPPDPALTVPQIRVPESGEALGLLLSALYRHPERDLTLIGITGTNGKSSVTWMVHRALRRAGRIAGLVGTLLYDTGRRREKARETTPPPVRLYELLSEMREHGAEAAVLEVSSHALDQRRVAGLAFFAAVFTNLSRDHLDYHRDLESYYAAKRRLFTHHLREDGVAVVNVRCPWGRRLAGEIPPGRRIIRVGEDFRIEAVSRRREGLLVRILDPAGVFEVRTALFGDFQAENLLSAWAVLRGLGFSPEELVEHLSGVSAPAGRLEPVAEFRGARVFVDYAHTPEALTAALRSLRHLTSGRLVCVFGCGGNRDRGKRPEMGRVASRLADLVFVTSDNPRFEDPEAIVRDILSGMNGGAPRRVVLERREALREALRSLGPGDVLLVAGKGHEDYQEVRGRRIPFSDAEEIRRLVHELS